MSYILLFILIVCLFVSARRDIGCFVCFVLLFYRIATTLFYACSKALYANNSLFLGIFYALALILLFNKFSGRTTVKFYKNPVFISTTIVTILMFIYNDIGPYYSTNSELIHEFQSSYLINVFTPFLLLPFFVPNIDVRSRVISSIVFWGIFYVMVLLACFNFTTLLFADRMLLKETTDDIVGSIMLSRYMAMVVIISFLRFMTNPYIGNKNMRVFFLFLSGVFLLLVIIAGQRGTLLGIGLALMAFMLRKEFRRHSLTVLLSAIAIVLVMMQFVDFSQFQVFQRFSEFQNYQEFERYSDYFVVWDIFKENDFFWGLGTKGYFLRTGRVYPHNIILEHIADYGLIGLICILVLLFACIKYAISLIRYSENHVDLAVASVWIVLCFEAMVSESLLGNRLFYVFSGLLAMSYTSFKESQKLRR